MSTLLDEPAAEKIEPVRPRAETLAASVLILLLMTLAQRVIGFGRGIMFCRWLEPEQIGQWDVAFGFLNLAAPVTVLGLPGSFGRYVEYFRQRGQFHTFLKRTTLVSGLMCVVATLVIVIQRRWFSELIFGSADEANLVVWLAMCLATIILHNFLNSLFIAVRMYRIVTALQFFQSLGFAVLSLSLLWVWPSGAASVVIAYGLATMLSAIGAATWLRSLTAAESSTPQPVSHSAFWTKLVPFAMWMWVTNLLGNLFDLIDRYMIVHHSGMEVTEALRQVGYYHSSRIVPVLFVSIAGLLGSMITPHLSFDWELGRREVVVRRLNKVLKLLLYCSFAGSIAVLFVAPLLFEIAFQNKFQGGLVVLPWTLAYCTWFGTIAVAQNYLWCAERPGLSSFALLAGLLLNIGVNLLLLPRFGLEGAVWATTLANLAALILVYVFSQANGMHVDSGTWILSLAPAALGLGPWISLGSLAAISILIVTSNRVLIIEEKQQLIEAAVHGLQKLPGRRRHPAGGMADVM
ncbi:MAG: oligosaccharide flippase family protein [Planctomycetia bacterium]|nr:oligosaccharide flippase family protein [Planctomycetia bacterium]